MRFIHTSDWHLGRLFHGKHLTDDQAYLLAQFCDLVQESKVDAVIIAGDIYDRAVPPTNAVELLDDTLARLLLEAKVPVIMIAGNHDSPERIGFGSQVFAKQGLYVVGNLAVNTRPITLYDAYGGVEFMPFTYAEPALVRAVFDEAEVTDANAAMRFCIGRSQQVLSPSSRKVAIAHAFIAGGQVSESERVLSVGGSSFVESTLFAPFHYTALGHLHHAQTAGANHIRYSGSLLKYSFDEANQTKGIHIVDMDETGQVSVETIHLTPKHDVKVIAGDFYEILQNRQCYPASQDYISVKLHNREPIIDVFGQLSAIYPNLMQIERPTLMTDGALHSDLIDHRKMSEADLFALFYKQVTGEALTEEASAVFKENLAELMLAEREVTL